MSRRRARPPAPRPPERRASPLFVGFTVGAIALVVLGLLVGVIQGLAADRGDDGSSGVSLPIQVTPGSEEERMRERLKQDPNDVNAMMVLAELLANTGKPEEAIQWYEQAVQRRPDDPKLRIAFGETLMHSGHALDAEIQLQKAEQLSPADPQPAYLLGQLYEQAQPPRAADAARAYQRVVEMAPDSVYAEQAKERLAQLSATPGASASPTP